MSRFTQELRDLLDDQFVYWSVPPPRGSAIPPSAVTTAHERETGRWKKIAVLGAVLLGGLWKRWR